MQRPPGVIVAFLLAATWWVVPGAHHSVTGQFDVAKRVTLSGTIERVEWINPHAYVHLNVPASHGAAKTWALSTIPLAMMRKAGVTRAALAGRPGETVTVVVHPGFNNRPIGWIVRITYSDGHYYSLFE